MTRIGPDTQPQNIPTVHHGRAKISATWGHVELADPAWGGQRGWSESTLTVCPPGTSAGERMLLTRRARWTFWSFAAGVLLCAFVANLAPLPVALVVTLGAAAICITGQVVTLARTRRVRSGIRRLTVRRISAGGGSQHFGDRALFDECLAALLALDSSVDSGELTRVEHELRWAEVYDRLR